MFVPTSIPIALNTLSQYKNFHRHMLFTLILMVLSATACTPEATMSLADLRRSNVNSSKYKATATVIIEEELAESVDDNNSSAATQTVGKATIVRASTGETETFTDSDTMIVEVGDIITAWEGKTVITFFDGHTTTLTPVSKIQIVSMSSEDNRETISLYQQLGSSSNRVDPESSEETEFEISTDSSMASVRGTDFNLDICGPEQTFYQTFSGSIEVEKEDVSVFVDAGEQLLATTGDPMDVRPLPVAPTCGDDRVVIEYPLDGEYIFTSTVPIFGTVIHENFDYWKVEYKPLAAPSNSYSFLYQSDQQISNDLLTTLDLSHLENGDYTFRLMVVDKSGNYPEPCVANFYIYPRHAEYSFNGTEQK